ncbi:MAG: transposase [Crenarchaeota archaeon]|jgi:transposase-like protein|nr:transposase [Thermoproteota archaeon]
MASKGQKFKEYSNELKLEVLNKYLEGNYSYQYLTNQYKIPKGTIITWVYQYKKGKNITVNNRLKSEQENYKEKYEILKNYQAFLRAQREKK